MSGSRDTGGRRQRAFDSIHGRAIDRYTVMETLGEGAMGAVYAAYDPDLDRRVAIKLLRARLSDKHRKRLEREARALARLSHPNIVQVYDVGIHEGDVFVTMELVEGQSLQDWSRRRPRPGWREVLEAYLDAARGIAAMHEKDLIHRDIKPANVLIGWDGRVRVADFGLAAVASRGSRDSEASSAHGGDAPAGPAAPAGIENELDAPAGDRLTRTGTLLGTPAFMAPEQHFFGDVGPAADQYSLCAAIYEGIYGVLPFRIEQRMRRAEELAALVARKRAGKLAPPPAGSGVPGWVLAVLQRGMAPAPEGRYPSMHDLIGAFEAVPARRRRIRLALLAAAVLCAALAAVLLFTRSRTGDKGRWASEVILNTAPPPVPCTLLDEELSRLPDRVAAAQIRAGAPARPGSRAAVMAAESPCVATGQKRGTAAGAAACALAINAPPGGTRVTTRVTVEGTIELPPRAHLWTFISPATTMFEDLWWPQGRVEVQRGDATWKTQLNVGLPKDIGLEFDIAAAVVNHHAHLELLRYQCDAALSLDWPPTALPRGVAFGPEIVRVRKVAPDHRQP